jgi:hypothetical protein
MIITIQADESVKIMPNENTINRHDVSKNSASDPLAVLSVFERLEVGPVRLEPRRLIAPYRLFYNGKAVRAVSGPLLRC